MAVDDSTQIQTNSQQPGEATSDAGSVKQVPIPDQIKADIYAAAVPAAKSVNRGLRFSKLLPTGPMPDQQGTNQGGAAGLDGGGDGF